MNSPHYARIAARLVANEPVATERASDSQRARAVELIAGALSAKMQRRARRLWATGLVAVAAAGVLGFVSVRQLSRAASGVGMPNISAVAKANAFGTSIFNGGASQALVGSASLQEGGRLVAGDTGGATVRLSTGTELTIERETTLQFVEAGPAQRFFLAQGVLQAQVAKLAAGQRFIVRTPDAEVEVRGTQFQIAIVEPDASCAAGVRTRVSVSSGLVEVRGAGASTYVHAGETWPLDCSPHTNGAASAPERAALSPSASADRAGNPEASPRILPRAPEQSPQASREASSIARQNALFAAAVQARKRGDVAGALSDFQQLITLYPASPLSEGAAVQRMSLLRGVDPAAAKAAAREYLGRFPQGYAKSDAEQLAHP